MTRFKQFGSRRTKMLNFFPYIRLKGFLIWFHLALMNAKYKKCQNQILRIYDCLNRFFFTQTRSRKSIVTLLRTCIRWFVLKCVNNISITSSLIIFKASFLDDNRIQFLNEAAFSRLLNLKKVRLNNNYCIDEEINNKLEMAGLASRVNEQCGFCQVGFDEIPSSSPISCVLADKIVSVEAESLKSNELQKKILDVLQQIHETLRTGTVVLRTAH